MILRSEEIAALIRKGEHGDETDPLVITPTPDLEELAKSGAASVDLRLGTWFVSLRQARMTHLSSDHVGSASQLTKTHYVPFGGVYILHPRSFVLSVTLEWLRIPGNLAAYVIGRSIWGRRGLIIATATGVHPGFKGCLTLELSNVGEIPIEIKPGLKICQLFIHTVMCGDSKNIDKSMFVGFRKPTLGAIESDEVETKLSRSEGLTIA